MKHKIIIIFSIIFIILFDESSINKNITVVSEIASKIVPLREIYNAKTLYAENSEYNTNTENMKRIIENTPNIEMLQQTNKQNEDSQHHHHHNQHNHNHDHRHSLNKHHSRHHYNKNNKNEENHHHHNRKHINYQQDIGYNRQTNIPDRSAKSSNHHHHKSENRSKIDLNDEYRIKRILETLNNNNEINTYSDKYDNDEEEGNQNDDPNYNINKMISYNHNDNINVIKCPKCSSSENKVHVSQEQLNELRIDFVKRQILGKLRLKDPPQVTAVDYLPQPIAQMEYNNVKSKEDLDDFYARTSKKFIILEREYKECAFINKNPAICFSFKIDDVDTDNMDVNQAVLWVYNKPNKNDQMKQTLVVSEFEQQMSSIYLPKIKPIAIKSVDVVEGWIKIDIAWPIKKWVGTNELSHLIHITCNSCELDSKDGVIALEKEYQPFIVIDTQNRRQRSRQKRSVNCSAGVKECCREKLYISFKDIGWGDWIISPTGYDAYFCRGSCNSIASIADSNNHHSLVIKTMKDKFDRPLELIPCCTAKQFSQLELLFRDSNNTITQKFLPNMIVESCGCM